MYFPAEVQDESKNYFPDSFFDCFFEWKADWESEENMKKGATPGLGEEDDWKPEAQGDFESLNEVVYAFDMAEYLEVNYKCAGVCKDRLFWFAQAIDSIPDKECSGEVSEQIQKDGIPFMNVVGVSCLIFLFTWICQYSLWFRYKDS